MFKYDNAMEVYEIGRARVGGQPGEYPTVLAGSAFYPGHRIVSDAEKGIFQKDAAEALVRAQEEMSDLTGNPLWLRIVADHAEAMERYVEWYADVGKDAFLIDSDKAEARIAGARKAGEIGAGGRAVYGSLDGSVRPEEAGALRNAGITASVIRGFNPDNISVWGRMEMLTGGPARSAKGMLPLGRELGITRPLVDMGVTPPGIGCSAVYRSIFIVKSLTGEPVGGSYPDLTASWPWLAKLKKRPGKAGAYVPASIGASLMAVALGCDYCLYGPIEHAAEAFPAIALGDMVIADAAGELGTHVAVNTHPLYRLA